MVPGAITCANVAPELCGHKASLGYNELDTHDIKHFHGFDTKRSQLEKYLMCFNHSGVVQLFMRPSDPNLHLSQQYSY